MRAFWRIFLLFGAGVAASSQLLPDDYQDTQEPTPLDGSPIVVEISWNIKGVYEVNFREMSVLLAMYFRMQWREPRLKGAEPNGGAAVPLHSQFLERLWLPDLYIHEARDITSYKMVEKVEGLYLTPPDTILYSTLLQLKLACPMFFAKYPFDVQVCTMTVSSYNFGEDRLLLQWLPLGVSADPSVNMQLPNYDLHVTWANITSKVWCLNCTFDPTSMGEARLVLARRYTAHLLTVYLPSALFVAVAWASFFWPADVIPGRTVLIITSLLTVISMYAAVGQKSPETSYLKAVDVWLFLCIVLVVLTLFQYAVIITIKRKQKERTAGQIFPMKTVNRFRRNTAEDRGRDTPSDTPKTPSLISTDGPAAAYEKGEGRHAIRLIQYEHLVEMVGKIGIPLIFALSNIVYWSYYLS
ncbi:glutamate-gated chloride channel-like isoform X2 [Penaeus japonicus]|uniref:glutamate-gated chloride channel-like isoform X2 n=1 Tax=Penaeus japonicus TaxID=27405 RepID=UPI001C710046|nr:glutamate-gated chloride channel-like isoform X2 [Penaeus japonicus]